MKTWMFIVFSLVVVVVGLSFAKEEPPPDTFHRTLSADLWTANPTYYIHIVEGGPGDVVFIAYGMDSEEKDLLRLQSDGSIIWRGQLVETDSILVASLRDVVRGTQENLCGDSE